MKKLILILVLLSSCSTPEQLVTTSQIIKCDTITIETTKFVSLTRQERLAMRMGVLKTYNEFNKVT